mmetsp:Transcript_16360/g.35582  ORF Transcript_16360/g.35582 Transcript_16360/m.35582 type:complete len:149 (-) Transcript_16360:687-1133(-)
MNQTNPPPIEQQSKKESRERLQHQYPYGTHYFFTENESRKRRTEQNIALTQISQKRAVRKAEPTSRQRRAGSRKRIRTIDRLLSLLYRTVQGCQEAGTKLWGTEGHGFDSGALFVLELLQLFPCSISFLEIFRQRRDPVLSSATPCVP